MKLQALIHNFFSILNCSALSSLLDTCNSPRFLMLFVTSWVIIISARNPCSPTTLGMLLFAALTGHYPLLQVPTKSMSVHGGQHIQGKWSSYVPFHLWNWDSQTWRGKAGKRCLLMNVLMSLISLVLGKQGMCGTQSQEQNTPLFRDFCLVCFQFELKSLITEVPKSIWSTPNSSIGEYIDHFMKSKIFSEFGDEIWFYWNTCESFPLFFF